ncbi:MAG: cytidine deaminase [Armatimonadetes bacterium]|nr:cytidine deaminase [Armatimonadota bacterium]
MNWPILLDYAQRARENAYAPYSKYRVGAAILTNEGHVFSGCNVENLSFGGTICAERGSVMAMAAVGDRVIDSVLVVSKDGVTPCGMCLQVLAEFASPKCSVRCYSESGEFKEYEFRDLLPHGFRTEEVSRTDEAG